MNEYEVMKNEIRRLHKVCAAKDQTILRAANKILLLRFKTEDCFFMNELSPLAENLIDSV